MNHQEKYSDKELIDKILNKETALFELIIRRHNPNLYRIGKMYRFSHEDTQDLMQETYIEAFVHLHQFENRASFQTWISKIMIHQCYRKAKKWEQQNIQTMENEMSVFENLHNTETRNYVMNKELASVIEKALLNIPTDYRTVFTLREVNGMNVSETSQILGITESNVKIRLSRAKMMLRKEIEKFYNKEEIFEFNLIYCDLMVNRVMAKINSLN